MENRVKELLAKRGWSQRYLGQLTGKDRVHINMIANGSRPSLPTAQLIAQAFGCTVDEVFPVGVRADDTGD